MLGTVLPIVKLIKIMLRIFAPLVILLIMKESVIIQIALLANITMGKNVFNAHLIVLHVKTVQTIVHNALMISF